MFFIYNINTLCFRTIDNEKRKNIYFYLRNLIYNYLTICK